MALSRTLLQDMGFVLGSGWEHEVWVYNGEFWVHFDGDFYPGLNDSQISGEASTEEFCAKFSTRPKLLPTDN